MKVDYSSWSLRDATSDYNPREACKLLGREILELAIAELQLPVQQAKPSKDIATMLQNGSKLEEAMAKKDEQAVLNVLKSEKKDTLAGLLAKLLVE